MHVTHTHTHTHTRLTRLFSEFSLSVPWRASRAAVLSPVRADMSEGGPRQPHAAITKPVWHHRSSISSLPQRKARQIRTRLRAIALPSFEYQMMSQASSNGACRGKWLHTMAATRHHGQTGVWIRRPAPDWWQAGGASGCGDSQLQRLLLGTACRQRRCSSGCFAALASGSSPHFPAWPCGAGF